jgi:formylglycine-generating enzyme required for sulfatase activity
MVRDSYTRYPRAILWLLRGGEMIVSGKVAGGREPISITVGPFYIGKIPITNVQLEAFDPSHVRSRFSPEEDGLALGISHDAAAAYCQWYARVSRKPMRLPTEIEWEYACRGGTDARYFFGQDPQQGDSYMWDARNSGGVVRDPREKKPNPFGLLGMLGSVWEWTTVPADSRSVGEAGGRIEPGTAPGMLRGGSFMVDREQIGYGVRRSGDQKTSLEDVGFRIVRSF